MNLRKTPHSKPAAIFRNACLCIGSLAIALGLTHCSDDKTPAAQRSTILRLAHGPELRSILSTVKEQLSQEHPTLADGSRLLIELVPELAVPASRRLASGELKSESWIAPSSALVSYTNLSTHDLGARQGQCLPLFSTPVIVATQASDVDRFRALKGQFSWRNLVDASSSSSAAAEGALSGFSYSHGFPEASTSGLAALLQLAAFSAASPSQTQLTLADVLDSSNNAMLARYEQGISLYSMSESYLLERIAQGNAKRVGFAITTEQQLALFNQHRGPQEQKLVALYPEEGSIWEDYSLCTSEADWVTAGQRAAIKLLSSYLLKPDMQALALASGFRPREMPEKATSLPGTDLRLPSKTITVGSGEVVDQLLKTWQKLIKPAALMVVLDSSGSMDGESIRTTKETLRHLLARVTGRDKLGLVSFASEPKTWQTCSKDYQHFFSSLDKIQAVGGSAAYDGLRAGLESLTTPELNGYRRTLLLVTDGEGGNSEISFQGLQDYIGNIQAKYEINVLIVTLKRDGADFTDFEKLARQANGLYRSASNAEITSALQDALKGM